jgi:hypothetical protein
MTVNDIYANARARHGFLTKEEVAVLATTSATRLTPVLVRCGGCRFTCPAQDVAHLIALVESGQDDGHAEYVRDVSFPVGSQLDMDALVRNFR